MTAFPLSRRIGVAIALVAALVTAAPALAQNTTLWFGSTGDWSVPGNWSSGEPTATSTAVVQFAGTPTITMSGETCRSLWLGMSGGIVQASITGGSLTVVDSLRAGAIGTGTVNQQGGTVTAGIVVIGSRPAAIGSYLLLSGTLNTTRMECATRQNGTDGTFSASVFTPTCTISDSLYIGQRGSFVFGAGTLNVGTNGTGGVLVDRGAFQLSNAPTLNVRSFRMTDEATFHRAMIIGLFSPMICTGPVELNGQLIITDLSMPNGDYELIRGNPMTGTFDTFTPLGVGNWSWRVEGNSLWATKSDVAVSPTTWSRVKSGAGR
jgi:hypothetical protein